MSRYSQLYIERGNRTGDSRRARIRLRTLYQETFTSARDDANRHLQRELGVEITDSKAFFDDCEVRDFLDTITEVANFLKRNPQLPRAVRARDEWLFTADRIFGEENLAYRLDGEGIVHPYPDAEFAANTASALAALDQARFSEARGDFAESLRHLRNGEGKQALRMMFPAVESAAKVLFPGKFAGLAANEVNRFIKPALEARYAGNDPAIHAGRLLLDGMKDWINAAHLYRHGQGRPEPADPPTDFVVAHLSAGATYLRWMIELCSP